MIRDQYSNMFEYSKTRISILIRNALNMSNQYMEPKSFQNTIQSTKIQLVNL